MSKLPTENKILLIATSITMLGVLPSFIFNIQRHDNADIIIDISTIFVTAIILYGIFYTQKIKFFCGMLAIVLQSAIIIDVYYLNSALIYWLFPVIITCFYLLPISLAGITNSVLIIIIALMTYPNLDISTLFRLISALFLSNIFIWAMLLWVQNKNKKQASHISINECRNNILELIANSSNLSHVLKAIITAIENEYPYSMCSILLVDKSGMHLTLGAAPSLPEYYNKAIEGIKIGQGVGSCGTAAFTRQRVIVTDIRTHPYWSEWSQLTKRANLKIRTHPYWSEWSQLTKRANLKSCWSEPIINNHGTVLGTFAIYHHNITTPKDADFKIIEQFSQLACIAIERKKADDIVWRQANFDSLTNLPNRNLLHEHITAAIKNAHRDKKQLAIIMLDLDNFKDVNDSLGHNIGDRLLIECAKRINSTLRNNDIVARLGGDEFIIGLVGTSSGNQINRIAQNLSERLAQPYLIEHKKIHCTSSMGIAVYNQDANSINTLLRNADQAMYAAKAKGRNHIHFFTPEMRIKFIKRMEIIKDLRTALSQQQFYMMYQPIVDLSDNTINKAEALIRWLHPKKGLIAPQDFIPIAEETGLIVDISEWVFNQVTQQLKYWRQTYNPNFVISINTSPVQYRNEGQQIIAWTNSLLAQNIAPQALVIEITENLLMENPADVAKILSKVRKKGIGVSIDDFGTGFCSLSYLKQFTIDYLKIDQSFIKNMTDNTKDAALCEAIIVMSNKLNINVIAEGIETEQQKQFLQKNNCQYGQGFLLSKPLTSLDFQKLLMKQIHVKDK